MNALLQEIEEAKENLRLAYEKEAETEEAIDSMERKYWEGYLEALESALAISKTDHE
jgi:hypothetical protein